MDEKPEKGGKANRTLPTFFHRTVLPPDEDISFGPKRGFQHRDTFGIEEYELRGRLPARLRGLLVQRKVSAYSKAYEASFFDTSSPVAEEVPELRPNEEPFLSIARGLGLARNGHGGHNPSSSMSSVQFSPCGRHLLSTAIGGSLAIHNFECGVDSGAHVTLKVWIPLNKRLEVASWNPCNPNEVACVADRENSVFCIDFVSGKTQVLDMERDGYTRNRSSMGLFHLKYSVQSRYRLLACGREGRVFLWDRRKNSPTPSASIQAPPAMGPLHCLELSEDEQVVYAGTESGVIQAWDLRGGRQSAAFCGAKEVYHAPLTSFSVQTLLSKVPTLQEQAGSCPSAVQSLLFDPANPQHLGFHLFNACSGVLDIGAMELSHVHCPPPPWSALEGTDTSQLRYRPRRPAWLATDSIYCAPSGIATAVHLLDFGATPWSRSAVHSASDSGLVTGESKSTFVNGTDPIMCVATHPTSDFLVAGTEGGSLILLVPRGEHEE